MTRDGYPNVFPGDDGEKLSADHVALKTDLLVFDSGRSTADVEVGRKLSGSHSHGLRQRSLNFVGINVNFGFRLRTGRKRGGRSRFQVPRWSRLIHSAGGRPSLLPRPFQV